MKALFTFLLFILFLRLNAQQYDAGNFYLYFWHPNFHNPGFQSTDSSTIINSLSSWEEHNKTGCLNIAGGVVLPYDKDKLNIGFNYFSFHEFLYQSQEAGIFLNKKINLGKKIKFSSGLDFGIRSQSYFVKEDRVLFPSTNTIKKGYYNKNSFRLNAGFNLEWGNFFFGISCRNCFNQGYNFSTGDRYTPIENLRRSYYHGGYILKIKRKIKLRLDALWRNVGYGYMFDGSISSIFADKYYFGFSMRNNFPVDPAFHFGYKWKNFWLLGVLEPPNRYDSAAFEIAAQLQISKIN